MSRLPCTAVPLLLLTTLICPTRVAAQQPDTRREVTSTIQAAIGLLERGRHTDFVKTFLRPAELEELVEKHGSIERVAAEFGRNGRPAALLEVLRAAFKMEPAFDKTRTVATFRFDPPVADERRLSLQKIGGRWFLRD